MVLCSEWVGNPDKDQIGTCPFDSSHAVTTGKEYSDGIVYKIRVVLNQIHDVIPGWKYGIFGLWNTKMPQQKL